ncbi:non-hydrolyzing UDP-N-acetylglucosamine 2-epimerase [Cetobacterium sp.]|uniref:non-hydrolyzing UDP-N-acetylglucosamine 2-epimerase n=1 Tax=Cetobacterium sp. TaxID=2071632 RepID=UPI003F32D3B6
MINNHIKSKMKIALIFGTRPEAIKMAPVYHTLKKNNIDVKVISTGQHKEMLYQVLNLFEIEPDYELKIMKEGQNLSELTSRLVEKLENVIKKEKFDFILVQGDTTSAFVGALVGFYNKVPIGHIEAGLRTGDIYSPFPEEANRKLIGNIAKVHFAPTSINVNNLLKEGYNKESILEIGNTVIDALYWVKKNKSSDLEQIREKYNLKDKKYILMTMHRRENWGKPMRDALKGIRKYLEENKELYLVFPMHLNPTVRKVIKEELDRFERKILIEPLEYLEFISIMDGSHFIMTDSGGVQEEAPSLGKPTLVLRDTTERPEAIEAGTAKLVGTSSENIYNFMKLLEGDLYKEMSRTNNPYGDGKTSEKILHYLLED